MIRRQDAAPLFGRRPSDWLTLVLFFGAVFAGATGRLTIYIDRAGADVWVSQAGVRTMHMSTSSLPASVTERVKAVQGVDQAVAVRDISLEVRPGEVVLIMGPSGSGKSTLLLMLGALLKPTEGRITLNGLAISDFSERRLPDVRLRHFGFIFQDFNLLSALSVQDNVAFAAELTGLSHREAREQAASLLTGLGLGHRLDFPTGKLSGGEKQRVAIARSLVNDPTLILADEPTANLDSSHGHETMRLLRDIAKEGGRSVVIVSHDARIKDIADRVLWLEDGQFKDMVEMATDPVCGMAVERKRAVPLERDGDTLYFCATGCRDEFVAADNGRAATSPTTLGSTMNE